MKKRKMGSKFESRQSFKNIRVKPRLVCENFKLKKGEI